MIHSIVSSTVNSTITVKFYLIEYQAYIVLKFDNSLPSTQPYSSCPDIWINPEG